MNHNESLNDNEVELIKLETNTIDPNVVQSNFNHLDDKWDHLPERDLTNILINEKTVYAVNQSMNVIHTDINGNILYGNQNIFDLTLYNPEELFGGPTRTFNASYHTKEFFEEMWDTILSGKIWRGDLKNKRKDGNIIWVRMIITPLLDKAGSPYQFVALKEDITDKKEMEFRLAQKDKQLSALTSNSYDIIGIIDNHGKITYLNPAFERVLGFSSSDSIGSNLVDYFDEQDVPFGRSMLEKIMDNPNVPIRHQIKVKHKDSTMRWCDIAFTNYLEDQYIQGIVFNLRDFTKQKEATDIINHIANYDYLTGLPNRRNFENHLIDALKKAKSTNRRVALLFLDLDGFKKVNDTLGHEIGDGLLKEVGKRIKSVFHTNAFVGRLGGDEFSIIIPDIVDFKYLNTLADSLVKSFNHPFTVEENLINISASIGISIYPLAGEDMRSLLKNADAAMYQAKNEGKNNYQLFSSPEETS